MPDEQLELPLEVFDRKIKWPRARKEARSEPDHPATIPDTPDGPFKDWIKEKFEDKPVGWTDDELGSLRDNNEEIGYEGER